MNRKLEIKTGLLLVRYPGDVFHAIVNPDQMKNYFIESASGPMIEGETVTWKFPEFDRQFPVRVDRIVENKYISFFWNTMDGTETQVEISLTETEPGVTFVQVSEKARDMDEAGIEWLKSNTEGWANFLAFLKAWLEYGINLRKKAFHVSRLPKDHNNK